MLTLFRTLVCLIGGGAVLLAALSLFKNKPNYLWTLIRPRDADDFKKRYGDRPPY